MSGKLTRLLLRLFFLLLLAGRGVSQVAIIAHKSVPEDTLTRLALIDFYTGDIRKWNDGNVVVVLELTMKSDVKNTFYDYLGKSSSRMKSIWLKKVLSGEGDPPITCNSEEEILQKISVTPGAIGFIDRRKVNREVKTLLVIPPKPSS